MIGEDWRAHGVCGRTTVKDSPREQEWKFQTIDSFLPLSNPEGWESCSKCGEKPRLWIFDNGCEAQCLCFGRYGACAARVESITSWAKRHGGSIAHYSDDHLRERWNLYAKTGERQDKLPEGQW